MRVCGDSWEISNVYAIMTHADRRLLLARNISFASLKTMLISVQSLNFELFPSLPHRRTSVSQRQAAMIMKKWYQKPSQYS